MGAEVVAAGTLADTVQRDQYVQAAGGVAVCLDNGRRAGCRRLRVALQLQVACSGTFKGAGIVAAGPYYCGKGGIVVGLVACGTGLISTDPDGIEQIARRWSAEGRIDSVSNLAGKPVYTYHGTKDPLVRTSVSDEGVQFYRDFGARTAYHDTDPAGHGWPTPNTPLSCDTTFYPFLINCGNDPQGEMLGHWLGQVNPPAASPSAGTTRTGMCRGGWPSGTAWEAAASSIRRTPARRGPRAS
ncbi:hypothetical protein OG978_38110 [Streptomyces sp. NBC_01591]|uniref:hypothetical protein n=1 Tax=Streptomyces sp. NBC_01591 TaxID=2975888 RepID=UPI002DDA4CEB|nr:hypothetical protein [Streptomyces sp. NBC_01591]WSD72687.1 hypothetical protein OG978_38110 [Streptomyces sp. NBC_01591]